MSELPNGWKLEYLVKYLQYVPTGVGVFEGTKKYYSTGSIAKNEIAPEGTYIFSDKPSRANRLVIKNDLIQARMKSTNKATLINDQLSGGLVSTGFIQIRIPDEKYLPLLAYHYLNSDIFLTQRDDYATGSTQEALTDTGLKKITIPVPPLSEQQKIVDRLELLLGKINPANERLNKIPAILERFRQSVLSAACSGRLTEDWREGNICENSQNLINKSITARNRQSKKQYSAIDIGFDFIKYAQAELPKTWLWTAIANYGVCSRGRFSIRPRNDPRCYDGEYPFIQIGDLPREGGFINSHKQTLNDFGLKTSKMFPRGTVVIAIVGATIANTGILAYDMCFPDSMVGVETGTEAGNKYIEYYLRFVKEDIRQISYAGGGQPNIKLETLEPYPMPLPPLPEQEEIIRRVDKMFAIADKIEERYNKVKRQLERAEKAIYAKAFRGEL